MSIVMKLALVGLTSAMAAACADPGLTAPVDGAEAHLTLFADNGEEVDRPFRLSGFGVFAAQEFAPGFPAGLSDFGGRCSIPSHFVIRFTVGGQATHLGRFTGSAEHCTQLDFSTGSSTQTDGTMVFHASNGDELRATYVGSGAPGRPGETTATFASGTGRFVGATGSADGITICNPATGRCPVFELDGVVTFAGSSSSQ